MQDKLAIIASGGGMKCSYGAGVLTALGERFKVKPDILVGGSGGVGSLSYFACGQYSSIKNIWTNLLSNDEFLNPKRLRKIMDIDYLIDEVFKKQDPLDVEQLVSSGINYQIATTNVKTGRAEHFSPESCDVFELMRASKAMPVLYRKKVLINGKEYFDTYASSMIGLNILKALELGANRLIIVDNDTPSKINRFVFSAWTHFQESRFRKANSSEIKRSMDVRLPTYIDAVALKPQENFNLGSFDNSKSSMEESFDKGFSETLKNKKLVDFLG